MLLCLAEQPLNQYSLRAPLQWQQLQGEAVSCRQTCPRLSPLVQRPRGGELIINLSNSCLILFIVNRFRTVILPSSLLHETHNTHDQAHYYRGQSVSIPQQGDRGTNLWFCLFSLIPVAVTSNRARAVDASQHGACIFQMHNLNRWHRHVFSRLLRAWWGLPFWRGCHPYWMMFLVVWRPCDFVFLREEGRQTFHWVTEGVAMERK